MIRLNLETKPCWVDLGHGVRVKVVPITSALIAAASSSAELTGLPPETTTDVRMSVLGSVLARLAILEWEGVGDEAGAPLDPTPDGITALMDLYQLNMAFRDAYLLKGFMVAAEKKGSAPLPSGTLAGAPTIAAPAPASAKNAQA